MQQRARVHLFDFVGRAPVPYDEACRLQQALLRRRLRGGAAAAAALAAPPPAFRDMLLALEHRAVYTLGRSARPRDLLFAPSGADCAAAAAAARELGLECDVVLSERGGQITYHGPGQLVVYPLLHLQPPAFRRDLHAYVRNVEEVVIRALKAFGVAAERCAGLPGVWVGGRKIAAVGMSCSKWFTSHGFAVNVRPEVHAAFARIVPCGLADREVTSLARELGTGAGADVSVDIFKEAVLTAFCDVFGCDLVLSRSGAGPLDDEGPEPAGPVLV